MFDQSLLSYLSILKNFYENYYFVKRSKVLPMHYGMQLVYTYLYLTGNINIEYVNRRFSYRLKINRLVQVGKYINRLGRGALRKKKNMFKLKILFDRLFLWLYKIPNVDFFLAEKIKSMAWLKKNSVVSFLYQKQFKKLI